MPPKPSTGKKKLTKAEKEKLKKEEAEQKAREEEEARLLAEQEEKERLERDRVEAEERRRLENEERKRRKVQLLELENTIYEQRVKLLEEGVARRKQAKWDRYMLCDGSPDPTDEPQINTYLNLWHEETEHNDIDSVLNDSLLAIRLSDELKTIIDTTPSEELTENKRIQFQNTINAIHKLLQHKLDLASHKLSLKASQLADSETMNLQRVYQNNLITLCMWGNLSKNPRIKSHEFAEKGFTFEIPKLLTLSDIGIRVLFTQYDHLSEHCRTFIPRIKEKTVLEDPEIVDNTSPIINENCDEDIKESDAISLSEQNKQESQSLLLNEDELPPDESAETGEEIPRAESEMEQDFEINTPMPTNYEEFDGDDDIIDLRSYRTVGGVFFFDLFHLPPQPKDVNNMIITQLVDPPQMEYMSYVSEEPVDVNESQHLDDSSKDKRDEKPLIGMKIRLPEDVYFSEEPQVVKWNYENNEWSTAGFSDHDFNEENRMLSVKTNQFGTMALIQDLHINMPFQSWELRPRGINHAQLLIIAAIVEIEIQIKNGFCCLSQPTDKKELSHLISKWMTPRELILALQTAGINVFPAEDSYKYVSIQAKNPITEERLYQQMALTASSMAYTWSKWNTDVTNSENIVIQGAEQLKDEPLLEDKWSLYLVTKKRTTKLRMNEFDESFSDDYAEGTEFHADMYHMVLDVISNEGKQKILNTDAHFTDAVSQILSATKIITYS